MGEFEINLPEIRKSEADMMGMYEEVKRLASVADKINNDLSPLGFKEVRGTLAALTDEMKAEAGACREMGTVLQEIEKTYRDTEARITSGGILDAKDNASKKEKNWFEKLKNLLDDMWKRWTGNREVEPYEIDSIVFDVDGDYGGDQGSPKEERTEKLNQLYQIIRGNIRGIETENFQWENYLEKLNSEGCGYVALTNVILQHFEGREAEFEKTFGYQMYGEDGTLNFDLLLVDLYSTMDNIPIDATEPDQWNDYDEKVDGSREEYDPWNDISGSGTSQYAREYYIEQFLADHGIEAKADTDVKVDIYNYDNLSEDGKSIIIAFRDGNLYNEDGEVETRIEGGHAMVVTGVTSDGRMIVSSWGKKYYIDPYENAKLNYDGKEHETKMTFSTIEFN